MHNLRVEERTLSFNVSTKPGPVTLFTFPLKEGLPFCIKSIKWSYSIPAGITDSYGWPKVPLEITIDNICRQETASPLTFTTPVLLRSVTGSVVNRSHLAVELCLQFIGVLVAGDTSALADHQIAAFAALDNSQRSMLALGAGNFNSMLGLPGNTNTPLALESESTKPSVADQQSLLIGDLFQMAVQFKIPTENLGSLAEALIKKGWQR